MGSEDNKLKFLGLLGEARVRKEQLNYEVIADYLEEPVAKLKKWAREWEKQDRESAAVDMLLNIDDIVVERITDELESEFKAILHVNPVTGEIEKIKDPEPEKRVAANLSVFRDNVTGLQVLSSELQAAAGTLVGRVLELAQEPELTSRDLGNLATALTSIQNAFFNKPTTNIQVNTVSAAPGQTTLLEAFKGKLKS